MSVDDLVSLRNPIEYGMYFHLYISIMVLLTKNYHYIDLNQVMIDSQAICEPSNGHSFRPTLT